MCFAAVLLSTHFLFIALKILGVEDVWTYVGILTAWLAIYPCLGIVTYHWSNWYLGEATPKETQYRLEFAGMAWPFFLFQEACVGGSYLALKAFGILTRTPVVSYRQYSDAMD